MQIYIPKWFIYFFIISNILCLILVDILKELDPDRESYILSFIRKLEKK